MRRMRGREPRSTGAAPRRRCSSRRSSTTRRGEEHYDVVSAFIKSMRGSDPDAAVYWHGAHAGGGRGPALRPAPAWSSSPRGHRQRRPAGARGRHRCAARPSSSWGCPRGAAHDPGGHLPGAAPKSNTALTAYAAAPRPRDGARAAAGPAEAAQRPDPDGRRWATAAATSTRTTSRGTTSREEYLPEELRGHRYYQPSDSGDEREIAARQAGLQRRRRKKRRREEIERRRCPATWRCCAGST